MVRFVWREQPHIVVYELPTHYQFKGAFSFTFLLSFPSTTTNSVLIGVSTASGGSPTIEVAMVNRCSENFLDLVGRQLGIFPAACHFYKQTTSFQPWITIRSMTLLKRMYYHITLSVTMRTIQTSAEQRDVLPSYHSPYMIKVEPWNQKTRG